MEMNSKYQKAFDRIKETLSGTSAWRLLLSEVIYEVKSANPRYDWVGIYLLKGDTLVLETYLGKPTEHSKIPLDKGICGDAATEKKTIIVEDVSRERRYIACDLAVKSEIVVPIMNKDKIIGVIDIDSNQRNPWKEQDVEFLELVAALLANTCPKVKLT